MHFTSESLNDNHRPNVYGISGGRSSAYMLKMAIVNKMLNKSDIFSFQNTGKEKLETLDFIHEIEQCWNVPIVWLEFIEEDPGFVIVDYKTASREGEPFERLLQAKSHGNFLPNVMLRLCTYHLKIKTLQAYLKTLGIKKYNAITGIRADEPKRIIKADLSNLSGKNNYHYVLPLAREVTSNVVNAFWNSSDFDLAIDSIQGNCDLCFLKGKAKLIQLIRADPSMADWWIEQEKKTGKTFHKIYSYSELKHIALTQTQLIEKYDWNEIECIGCTD